MLVVDTERSEVGPQRRRKSDGRPLHCCCICGELDVWGAEWSRFSSIKDEDDGTPYAKFCSAECRARGGASAKNVTEEMKRKSKEAEWREPEIVYRPATDKEKYHAAVNEQSRTERGRRL